MSSHALNSEKSFSTEQNYMVWRTIDYFFSREINIMSVLQNICGKMKLKNKFTVV